MIDNDIVRIIVERIKNKGLNPKTNKSFVLDDIINPEYKKAIEGYTTQRV